MKFRIVKNAMASSNQVRSDAILCSATFRCFLWCRYCLFRWKSSGTIRPLCRNSTCAARPSSSSRSLFCISSLGFLQGRFPDHSRHLAESCTIQSSTHFVSGVLSFSSASPSVFSVDKDCPRLLINMEAAGNATSSWDLVSDCHSTGHPESIRSSLDVQFVVVRFEQESSRCFPSEYLRCRNSWTSEVTRLGGNYFDR